MIPYLLSSPLNLFAFLASGVLSRALLQRRHSESSPVFLLAFLGNAEAGFWSPQVEHWFVMEP